MHKSLQPHKHEKNPGDFQVNKLQVVKIFNHLKKNLKKSSSVWLPATYAVRTRPQKDISHNVKLALAMMSRCVLGGREFSKAAADAPVQSEMDRQQTQKNTAECAVNSNNGN